MSAKRILTSMLLLGLLAVMAATGATTQVGVAEPQAPQATAFTYQGELQDAGEPVDGNCDLRFRLWDAAQGGTQVGSTLTLTGAVVSAGLFTAQLDFGASAFTGDARWLEVAVRCPAGSGSYQWLAPRQALTASPYSLYALRAPWGGLSDVPPGLNDGDDDTTYSAGDGLVLSGTQFSLRMTYRLPQGCTEGHIVEWDGAGWQCGGTHNHWGETWSGSGTGLTLSGGSTGLSGSGDTNGLYGVSDSPGGRGVYGRNTASSGTANGVYGRSASTEGIAVAGYATAGSGTTFGAYGKSLSPAGRGVYGWASATGDAAPYGVYGRSDAEQGRGVFGYATATSGENYGVRGVSESPAGYGVYGWNTATSPGAIGVYGRTSSSGGKGVVGYASSASGGTGVWGKAESPSGHAGYFLGRVHASAAIDGAETLGSHAFHFQNNGNNPDVLALVTGNAEHVSFATFFMGIDHAVGAIESDGGGGVTYKSPGADYAEFLPRLDTQEAIEPGDLVGVFSGRVTRATRGADQVLAVSTGPIVLGNDPGDEEASRSEKVAFLGQVQVRVRGPVAAGDLIVPSGLEDGTGIAVAPEAITAEQFAQAVGQAWESSAEEGVKEVLVAVGLLHHDPTVAQMAGQVEALETRLAALESLVAAMASDGTGGGP